MSELTVRTPQGSWLNICDSEWYKRNDKNDGWDRLDPHVTDIKVRHGSNLYWLDVTCNRDSFYCPVPATAQCWPGFSGNFDGGNIIFGGDTGYEITECDDGAKRSYSGMTNFFNVEGGRFNVTSPYVNGYTLPLSWAGGAAEVSEILVNPGAESGQIFVDFDDMGDTDLRFRVYQNCKLLGDNKQYGNSFSVFYTEGEGPVFLRVDAPRKNMRWLVRANAVNTDILSSISSRAPCFGTYGARMRCITNGGIHYQDYQAYEAVHTIEMEGRMYLDYDFGDVPAALRIFYGQEEIAAVEETTGRGSIGFVPPFVSIDNNLVVRVETQPHNNEWNYSLYCADTCGAMLNKCMPVEIEESPSCSGVYLPTDNIMSRGAPQTSVNIDFDGLESGKVYLSYVASDEVQFVVYQNGEVIAGSQPTKGKNMFAFRVDLSGNRDQFIKIVVLGPCCPQWEFTVTQPVPEPDITIEDNEVTRGRKGTTTEICFPISTNRRFDEPIYIEYETIQQTAYESSVNMALDFKPSTLIASNVAVASKLEYGNTKIVVDAGLARFRNGVMSATNRTYWNNVFNWLGEIGKKVLIINTTTEGAAYSVGAGTEQIPLFPDATVVHYAGADIEVSIETMLAHDIIYLLATNSSLNLGLANSHLSVETYRNIVTFADNGKAIFIGTVDGTTAAAVNIFRDFFGCEARGRVAPVATTGAAMDANYGFHAIRSGIGTMTFSTSAQVMMSNVKRNAEASDFCIDLISESAVVENPTYVHPTQEYIFSKWDRWQAGVIYPVGSSMPADSRAWASTTVGGRVVFTNTRNTAATVAILSPEKFDKYTYEIVLSTTRSTSDDDFIGVVLGSAEINGTTQLLSLWRTRYAGQHRWDIGIGTRPIGQRGSSSFDMSGVEYQSSIDGQSGNWNTSRATKLRIIRQGTQLNIYATVVYNPASGVPPYTFVHEIDLTKGIYAPFAGAGRYGYTVCSQQHAMWSESFFENVVRPPLQLVPTDYKRTSGTLVIDPCETEAEICVPVCGTNLVGPDVFFHMRLISSNIGFIERPIAIGTIKNDNVADCPQYTEVEVGENGLSPAVRSNAMRMYCDRYIANAGFSAVMEADIDLPLSGTYRFVFHGSDVAELFVDCDMIVRSVGGVNAIEATTFLYKGTRKFYINYYTNTGKTRRVGQVALAIYNPLGQLMYSSKAADWRGKVLNPGIPPYCEQFEATCNIVATGGVVTAYSYNDVGVGYGTQRIRSVHHSDNCAPGNTYYTLERTLTFPVSGNYRFIGTGDDTLEILVDCKTVFSKGGNWESVGSSTVYVEAGERLITVIYLNVPNCTPGWVKFAILQPNGSTLYASAPAGWVSKVGSLSNRPTRLYESYISGGYVLHISSNPYYGGPDYNYWCADRRIVIPENGLYFIQGIVDDIGDLYIGCTHVAALGNYSGGFQTSALFELTEGEQNMAIRCYNYRSKHANYAGFRLYKADGTLVYESRAEGWRAAWRDLDFSGIG